MTTNSNVNCENIGNQLNSTNIGDVEMGSKEKYKSESPKSSSVARHLTTLTHFLTCAYVILILYLCFTDEVTFFTWHPILLSVGWMFLMTEGVLVLSRDNKFPFQLNHKLKITTHWVLEAIGLVLILAGFVVVYVNKNRLQKSHFKSWHGIFGLIGILGAIPTCINGVCTLYSSSLKHIISPKLVKLIHILTGTITVFFGGLSLLLSVYTKWFNRHTQNSTWLFSYGFVCVLFAIIWTLWKPIKSLYKRINKKLYV